MLVLNSCVWSEYGHNKSIIKLLKQEEEIYNNTILTRENVASFLGIFIPKNYKTHQKCFRQIQLELWFTGLPFQTEKSFNSFFYWHSFIATFIFHAHFCTNAKTQKDTQGSVQ